MNEVPQTAGDARVESAPSRAVSAALIVACLVPGLLGAAVGLPLVVWNFTDADQRAYSGPGDVVFLLLVAAANLAPFVAVGIALRRARRDRNLTWARALRAVAPLVVILSAASLIATMAAAGGM